MAETLNVLENDAFNPHQKIPLQYKSNGLIIAKKIFPDYLYQIRLSNYIIVKARQEAGGRRQEAGEE
jgi:hypothetical protein